MPPLNASSDATLMIAPDSRDHGRYRRPGQPAGREHVHANQIGHDLRVGDAPSERSLRALAGMGQRAPGRPS
jgi:hypothetical protein